jgi:flagellar biosynthesis/type III secretory pathway protein FliH
VKNAETGYLENYIGLIKYCAMLALKKGAKLLKKKAEMIAQMKAKEATRREIRLWGDGYESGYDTGYKRGYNEGFEAALQMNIGSLQDIIDKLEQLKNECNS